jgi:hypothetical protein
MRGYRLITGIISIGIYILVVGLLVLYFNIRDDKKPQKFVKKDEHKITVSLSSMQLQKQKSKKIHKKIIQKQKPKNRPKKHLTKRPNKKRLPKKHTSKKNIKKIVHKKKIDTVIKKKKAVKNIDKNITKKQRHSTPKDLFANIKVISKKPKMIISDKPIVTKPKNNLIKLTNKRPSAIQKINNSLKKQLNKKSGVKDAYLARVQEQLEDWPAQSDFAGESVKVILYIKPSGKFTFEIKSASANPNFNISLSEYLTQLQAIGFGRHNGGHTYIFEANFIAKE